MFVVRLVELSPKFRFAFLVCHRLLYQEDVAESDDEDDRKSFAVREEDKKGARDKKRVAEPAAASRPGKKSAADPRKLSAAFGENEKQKMEKKVAVVQEIIDVEKPVQKPDALVESPKRIRLAVHTLHPTPFAVGEFVQNDVAYLYGHPEDPVNHPALLSAVFPDGDKPSPAEKLMCFDPKGALVANATYAEAKKDFGSAVYVVRSCYSDE